MVDVSEKSETTKKTMVEIIREVVILMVKYLVWGSQQTPAQVFLYNCFQGLVGIDPWAVITALGEAEGNKLNPKWIILLYNKLMREEYAPNYVRVVLIKFTRAFTGETLLQAKTFVEEVVNREIG